MLFFPKFQMDIFVLNFHQKKICIFAYKFCFANNFDFYKEILVSSASRIVYMQ